MTVGKPYAALAIIQHQWDTDHLDVWVIFRHPMDQDLKPPLAKWLCEADGVPKDTSASVWQDQWTLLLTVDNVNSLPNETTLEYDGPDINLKTTWGKQWEPWGPILSLNIPYGWEDIIVVDTTNRRVGINGPPTTSTFEVISADFSDRIEIFHDNTDAHIRWSDGFLILQTTEGTNTSSYLDIRGKGYAGGVIFVRGQDDDEYLRLSNSVGTSRITSAGTNPVNLSLQRYADVPIVMFIDATDGETEELQIYGFRSGDEKRHLDVAVGINAADQVTFFGLSNYRFSGNIKPTGSVSSGTSTNSTGPGTQDAVDVAGINTLFLDCSANAVIIGGFINGINGQILHISRLCATANNATLEHNEGGGNQDIFLHAGADETLIGEYGGWTLACNGSNWYDLSHSKHV